MTEKKVLKAINDVPLFMDLPDDIQERMRSESPKVSHLIRNLEDCDDCEAQGIKDLVSMSRGLPGATFFIAEGLGFLRKYVNRELTVEQYFDAMNKLLDKHERILE